MTNFTLTENNDADINLPKTFCSVSPLAYPLILRRSRLGVSKENAQIWKVSQTITNSLGFDVTSSERPSLSLKLFSSLFTWRGSRDPWIYTTAFRLKRRVFFKKWKYSPQSSFCKTFRTDFFHAALNIEQSCYCLFQAFLVFLIFALLF